MRSVRFVSAMVLGATLLVSTGLSSVSADTAGGFGPPITGFANASDISVSPDGTKAYVTNGGESSVSVVDTASNAITGSFNAGFYPSPAAFSPDGTKAYVPNTDNDYRGYMSVVDVANDTVTSTVELGEYPSSVAFTPDGTKAFVVNSGRTSLTGSVSVIDVASDTVTASIPVAGWPSLIRVAQTGATAYVAGIDGIAVIDVLTNMVVRQIPTDSQIIEFDPDVTTAYVASAGSEHSLVTLIDLASGTTVRTIDMENTDNSSVRSVVASPDGKSLYVVTLYMPRPPVGSETMWLIDVATGETATITSAAGINNWAFGFSPSERIVYVAAHSSVLVFSPAAPAFTQASPSLSGVAGRAYSDYQFSASGFPAPTFAVTEGELPEGLVLTSAGALSGTPIAVGSSKFTIEASNAAGPNAITKATITVAPDPNAPVITSGAPVGATVGEVYSFTVTASGDPTPEFSLSTGSTPAGLTLSSTGVLSGTPTEVGPRTFTVVASNGVGQNATMSATITVAAAAAVPAPTVTPVAVDKGALASTGMNGLSAMMALGGALLAAGLLALSATTIRKRRVQS